MGDRALIVRWGDVIDEAIHRRVRAYLARLEAASVPGFLEFVPAFASAAIFYDPLRLRYERASRLALELAENLDTEEVAEPEPIEIPAAYGGAYGPDLPWVAERAGLSEEEAVRLHLSVDYRVYMIGFAPGFPYLGETPPPLAARRHATPRPSVPAGSVGIAGKQTGIYPAASPGGWRLIGRVPLRLFQPSADPPSLLKAGDRVRFVSISPEEFERLAGENAR
jgi:inhibitor of KinA